VQDFAASGKIVDTPSSSRVSAERAAHACDNARAGIWRLGAQVYAESWQRSGLAGGGARRRYAPWHSFMGARERGQATDDAANYRSLPDCGGIDGGSLRHIAAASGL
jgi:hypothetical protein